MSMSRVTVAVVQRSMTADVEDNVGRAIAHVRDAAALAERTGAQVVGLAAPAGISHAGLHDRTFVPARRYHDGEVIVEARWFTRAELIEACESGEVRLPPSISIGAAEPARDSTSRTRRTLSTLCGMNAWPPNPGSTVITRSMSSSPSRSAYGSNRNVP